MKLVLKNVNKRLVSLALAGTMTFSLNGCMSTETELSGSVSSYDVLDANSDSDENGLKNGFKQVLSVEGEDFSLVIEYYSNDIEWIINGIKVYLCLFTLKG